MLNDEFNNDDCGNVVTDYGNRYNIYDVNAVYNFHNNNNSEPYEFDYADIEAPHFNIRPSPEHLTTDKIVKFLYNCNLMFKIVKNWVKNGCSLGFDTQ
tara:strand:+ start:220 stop:513 length:294 start_codon:yes stop_codon:yes gene_type:complete